MTSCCSELYQAASTPRAAISTAAGNCWWRATVAASPPAIAAVTATVGHSTARSLMITLYVIAAVHVRCICAHLMHLRFI